MFPKKTNGTIGGGAELESVQINPHGAGGAPNVVSVSSTAAAAILNHNGLRKSMQASNGGVRSLQTAVNSSNHHHQQQHHQQKIQQQQFVPNTQARQSHSQSAHTQGHLAGGQQHGHTLQLQQQHGHQQQSQQAYHSVAAQRLNQQNQIGFFSNMSGQGNPVNANGSYGGTTVGMVAGAVGTGGQAAVLNGPVLKHQNTVGVGSHGGMVNTNQLVMGTQQGLFPKITNLRIDNQSIPSSAHSQAQGHQGDFGSGQITSQAAMNVLKNSGGHISGMSTHHAHHHNLSHPNERQHFRGSGGSAVVNTAQAPATHPLGMHPSGGHQLKPLSSPRSSQRQPGSAQQENTTTSSQNDPNLLYQQQLQWKTKSCMNSTGDEAALNSVAHADPSKAGATIVQQVFPSPGPTGPSAQLQFEQQRAKQISSGSEKRLKLHQQRQYYSEQYRVQQQRQHQQTANAVLSHNGPTNSAQTQPGTSSQSQSDQTSSQRPRDYNNSATRGEGTNARGVYAQNSSSTANINNVAPANYRASVPISGHEAGVAHRSAEQTVNKVQQQNGEQSQLQQRQTWCEEKRQRHQAGLASGGNMHNTQMIKGQMPISSSMIAPNANASISQNKLIESIALSQQHQKPQAVAPGSGQSYQSSSNNQVFFKKRASSNHNSHHQNVLMSPNQMDAQAQQHQQQSQAQQQQSQASMVHQQIQRQGVSQPPQGQALSQRVEGPVTSPKSQPPPQGAPNITPTPAQPAGQGQSQQQPGQAAQPQAQQAQQQQQQQPKIPVICGFHKRILLITCQGTNGNGQTPGSVLGGGGSAGLNGMNPALSMSQARRIRNKNPNCNHNSNSVFYQPHYNNVKYDDSHKKKEDVLRKVFFKECAREEEKRLYNGSTMYPGPYPGAQCSSGPNGHMFAGNSEMARQQAFSQANDPNKHLQIIERILCEYLFVPQPFDRSQKQQLSNTQSLMMELGLDRALTPHRAFLLALIRAGKFNADNMLKVLSEVKTSATEFDNECIYCKYSQYALKESAKLLQKHQAALQEQAQSNPQQALVQQQQIQQNGGIIRGPSGEDIRIENLVRMFQTQLFKKSFINTSLMIIQRKMTEKYFQKYHNARQAQQAWANGQGGAGGSGAAQGGAVQYGPDGKPIEPARRPAKKTRPKAQQNLSSLEYLSKEIQKLSKNLANPRDKERYLDLKEKYYREFLTKVLKSNGAEKVQFPTASFPPYKYYIGRGNNSGIVRTALKSRFWWSMGDYDDWEDYNFIWTQWKSNKILGCLKSWKEVQEQEQKEQNNGDKKRSAGSTRAGGHIDSQLSTQATDKESTSSKENLITTPKKNKLASSTLGNTNSELQFKKQHSATANSSATKNSRIIGRGKKAEEKEEEKEENVTSHHLLSYSKMENNYHLSNKKAIFYNMKVYYEAIGKEYHQSLPLTFHIKEGLNDPQFLKFEQLFHDAQDPSKQTILESLPKFGKSLWIVKPGENTNRGCGIQVSKDLDHIKGLVQNTNINGNKRSYIIQKYIEKPLLYKNRKFDIRTFTMMCTINGNCQGYWYSDGYFRTSSREFTLKNVSNRYVHLTNDAVQKKLDDYGKFESGNKLSYPEFQKYLDQVGIKCDFVKEVVPRMRQLAQDSMRAVSRKIDPNRKSHSFEIFGYDFMIDEDLNPWMIEVNTNPCFELSSPYLARLIPAMVENALKIAVDPIFPPPPVPNSKKHSIPDALENKFELLYNQKEDADELKNLPIDDNMNGIIEEEEMEEEGSDIEEEDEAQE